MIPRRQGAGALEVGGGGGRGDVHRSAESPPGSGPAPQMSHVLHKGLGGS